MQRHQPGPRINAVALMGMTRRPTMRSARARLMMNMLDTFNTFKNRVKKPRELMKKDS